MPRETFARHSKPVVRATTAAALAASFLALAAPARADSSCEDWFKKIDALAPTQSVTGIDPIPQLPGYKYGTNWLRARVSPMLPMTFENAQPAIERGNRTSRYEVNGPVMLRADFPTIGKVMLRIYSASNVWVDFVDNGVVVSKSVDPACRDGFMYVPVLWVGKLGERRDVHIIN